MMAAETTSGSTALLSHGPDQAPLRRRLWRTAGWLSIAHVALLFAGAGLGTSLQLGDPAGTARSALVTSSLATIVAGGYLTYVGFLVLLVDGLLIARLLRGTDELTGWLSSCIAGTTVAWVATTLAAGLAAGAAAVYDGHHGASLETVTTVNDVRNVAFILTGGLAGLFLVAVAAAGRRTRLLSRPLTLTAAILGVASVVAVPGARVGLTTVTTMGWFVWFVAFGISAVRSASCK